MAISYRAAQNLIKRGDEAGLRAALESGLDPNLANQNGWSLLMLAGLEGATPLGQLLLDAGAAVDNRNRNGETPLSLAAQKGHLTFAKLLLTHGAGKDAMPHGKTLSDWINAAPNLTDPERTEMLQLLGL